MQEAAKLQTENRPERLLRSQEGAAAFLETNDPWFLIHTQPTRERSAVEKLKSFHVVTYLPLTTIVRSVRGKSKPRHIPFFPSYLFASFPYEFHRDVHESLSRLPLLGRVVYFGALPAMVDAELVNEIFRRQNSQGLIEMEDSCSEMDFQPGDRVEVVSGPLKGLQGIFNKKLSSFERVQILLDNTIVKGNRGDWNVQSKFGGHAPELHGLSMRIDLSSKDLVLA